MKNKNETEQKLQQLERDTDILVESIAPIAAVGIMVAAFAYFFLGVH